MKIKPNSDFSKKAREGVMEFLLLNHPLDCPICDQGGECDLQDQSMAFGSDRSRLRIDMDEKRAVEDKDIGPLVRTIMTRCIQCTRCVRFMNEIAGCPDLGTSGRGNDMQIGTYLENTALQSELSGNIVDICPVGALTSKPYTFTARPWELRRFDSVDVLDACGSNISVCQRAGDLMRIIPRTHEDINEEWLADKSRHAPIDGLKTQRLTVPMLRPSSSSHLQECDWEDALISLSQTMSHVDPSRIVAMVGPHTDAETMIALKDFFKSIGSDQLYVHVDSQFDKTSFPTSADLNERGNYLFNHGIANLEDADFILIIGANPRFEAPMVNHRIRKAWRNNQLDNIAVVGPKDMDLLYDYIWAGDDSASLQQILTGGHPIVDKLKAAKNAAVIIGQQILDPNGQSNVYGYGRAIADKFGASFNVLHANASQVAAFDLGFKPSFEMKLDGDKPSVLWLHGVDDEKLPVPKNCFVVYQVNSFFFLILSLKLIFTLLIFRVTPAMSALIKPIWSFRALPSPRSKALTSIWRAEHSRLFRRSLPQRWPALIGRLFELSPRFQIILYHTRILLSFVNEWPTIRRCWFSIIRIFFQSTRHLAIPALDRSRAPLRSSIR